MMFDVISEVEVKVVPETEVIVGLLALNKLVVLGYDVHSSWMRTDRR